MKRTIATSKTFMKAFFILCVLMACVSKIHAQRDPYLRPFANNSIWNMAIHNNAVYVDAKINAPTAWGVTGDPEIIILSPSAPNVGIFTAGWAGSTRCDKGAFITNAPIPDGWINGIPQGTPNNSTAILAQDGQTVINLQCLHRCATTGPASSLVQYPSENLYGAGIQGGHGGSGMSALGGSIRVGELTPNYTDAQIIADANIYIRHVIKMNVNTKLYVSNTNGGYRWPAVKADGAYNSPGACDYYGGTVPQFKMGSLLAIPKSVNVEAMGLTTAPGRIMARTLQKYGAYLVDATCWDVVAFECQTGPLGDEEDRFASKYGFIFGPQSTTAPWAQDIAKIIQELFVVDNNNAANIGGGPTTDLVNRLAPPICNIGTPGSGIYDCGAVVNVPVTSVTIAPTTVTVTPGATTTLTATVAPSNATNKNVTWSSNNTAVATVSSTGVVTGVAAGTATITVTTIDGSKTATCTVAVSAGGGSFNYEAENGTFGGGAQTQTASNASNGSVVGNLNAAGSFTQVSNANGGSGGTASLVVRYANGFSSSSNIGLYVNNTFIQNVSFPVTGGWNSFANVTVSISLPSGTGNTIKLQIGSGNAAADIDRYTVTPGASVAVTGVTLSPTTASIAAGATTTLTATVAPSNATNKNVTWSSNNTAAATVSSTGVVTGVAAGNATITVTTTDGNRTATCAVTVTATSVAVTGVTVSPTTASVVAGATTTLTATVAPSNATNKNVTWSSNNTAIATVSTTGVVTGVAAGTATVTVTTTDGSKTATCAVTVTAGSGSATNYEAENGTFGGGAQIQTASNASNGSVVGNLNAVGSFTQVSSVNGGSGGNASLVIRYANGFSATSTIGLYVNNTFIQNVSFPVTGGWNSFANVTVSITLPSGTGNTIKLQIGSGNAAADIDRYTVSPGGTVVSVTGVTLSPTTASIAAGATITLTATVAPSNATNKNVTWSSGNTAVATVSSTGVVTGVAAGNATITVTTNDGSKTANCAVTVTAAAGSATNYEAENGTFGGGAQIQTASNASNGSVVGNLNAVGSFTQVSSVNGGSGGTASLVIRYANGFSSASNIGLYVNNTFIQNVSFPVTGGWNSFANTTVSITLPSGIGNTIKLQIGSGNAAADIDRYTVTPGGTVVSVTGVTVSPTTVGVAAGGTTTLTATVAPSNASNKNVTWSSNNTAIATISTAGVVTGVAAGSATITVTTTDGSKTATSAVTVIPAPVGPLKIHCIGNSLTQADPGYRGVLKNKLAADGYSFSFVGTKTDGTSSHSGYGGYIVGPGASSVGNIYDIWTAGPNLNGVACDIIILEIGINDYFNSTNANYNPESPAAAKLDGLIALIYSTKPNVTIYVSNLTPVAWDANAFGPWNAQVPVIVNKYTNQGRKCYLADVRNGISWNLSTDISGDQLHPSAAGYTKMGNYYASLIESTNSKSVGVSAKTATQNQLSQGGILMTEVVPANKLTTSNVSIYPNPLTAGSLIISTPNVKGSKHLNIYDVAGNKIYTKQLPAGSQYTIDLSQLKYKGVCLVEVSDNKGLVIKKLIVN